MEVEEENYSEKSESSSKFSTNTLTVRPVEKSHFDYDSKTINRLNEKGDGEFTFKYDLDQRGNDKDSLLEFCPVEIYERNLLRNLQQQQRQQMLRNEQSPYTTTASIDEEVTIVSNSLQIPVIALSAMEKPPVTKDNVYTSDNMTIIDTDFPVSKGRFTIKLTILSIKALLFFHTHILFHLQERSSSDEIIGDASDIISAISNEEYSVNSEILDQKFSPCESYPVNVGEIIQDLGPDYRIGHIDSPETSETTDALHGESLMDDISSVLGQDLFGPLQDVTITDDTTTLCTADPPRRTLSFKHPKVEAQFGFENRVFDIDQNELPIDQPQKRYCSLAQFVEGNDIARKSFKRLNRTNKSASSFRNKLSNSNNFTNNNNNLSDTNVTEKPQSETVDCDNKDNLNTIKIQIQGSQTDLSVETEYEICQNQTIVPFDYKNAVISDDYEDADEKDGRETEKHQSRSRHRISVIVEPASPIMNEQLGASRISEYRRHSSHAPTSLVPREIENYRRHSGHNPNRLGLDSEHMRFLSCSPAASRRISCGTLFKVFIKKSNLSIIILKENSFIFKNNETLNFSSSRNIFGSRKSVNKIEKEQQAEKKKSVTKEEKIKRLPIINPLVRLPQWPNVSSGAGFISKCLLANADTLCAAVSPLMDPDETLLEGFHEKSVMNNYFGIGIDAKISLDFHNKREEHPEKCRSRAKNYMWYGVLGSKQWLQKTYKNLEQRVQLECDGQRIPLPSLQGLVILNIPSFMGGTNFWGGSKEDDCFLAPSFDDRILEVVAVFGSVQMAACRLINLQHHRIAQCQSVQINILGKW